MAAQPFTVLYMAQLEETRTQTEKPDTFSNGPYHAYAWSRTRMDGWAVAQSPILWTTITINRLKSKGYIRLVAHYKRYLSLSNRPIRDPYVRWCERRTGSHWAVSRLLDYKTFLFLNNWFWQYVVYYKKTRLKVAQQKPSSLPRFSQTSRIPPYLQNPDQSTKYIALAYRHAIYLVITQRFYSMVNFALSSTSSKI